MRLLLIKHGIYELPHELLNNLNPLGGPLCPHKKKKKYNEVRKLSKLHRITAHHPAQHPNQNETPPPKKKKRPQKCPPPKQQNRTSPPMAHKTPRPNRQTQTNAPEEKTTKRYSMSPPRRKPNNPTAPQTHPKTEIHSTHGSISLNKKKRSKTYRKTDYKKLKITSQKQPSYVFCEKSCF